MRRLLVALVAIFLVLTANSAIAGDDFIHFPDPYFKKVLVNMEYCGQPIIDLNGDGEIQYSEAAAYNDRLWLYCEWTDSITDLTGIKEFINVKKIRFEWTPLINKIDVSGMVNLEEINFNNCWNLEVLNVSGCKNLSTINCNDSKIKYLNAENCSKLKTIWCSNNTLETLMLLNCNSLKSLSLGKNNLENIDFNECINLEGINCSYNKLTKLDFSPLKNFKRLAGNNNQLKTVNVRNGNNKSITQFQTSGNPDLKCIEVDDPAYSKEHWKEIDEWTEFSEDCSNSVEENNQTAFKVYPNPANNILTIERGGIEQTDLRILNVTGRICHYQSIQFGETQTQIDISNLAAGTYIIKIDNETEKIVVE